MRITHAPSFAPSSNARRLTPEAIDSLDRARQTYRAATDTTSDVLRSLTRRWRGTTEVIRYYWYRARGDNPRHTAAAHADREICELVNARAPMEAGVRLEQHVGRSV